MSDSEHDSKKDNKQKTTQEDTHDSQGISRRSFLTATGALGAAAAVGPWFVPGAAQAKPKTLKILQWSHFVPSYDQWFDNFAREWGEANGIEVSVDHISIADLVTATSSELAAGSGHDLIELGPQASQFAPSAVNMTDINQEVQGRYGAALRLAERCSHSPITDNWYSFVHGWTIDPGDYRKSLWKKAGMPGGPRTWDNVLTTGAQIRNKQGVPVGLGMSQEYDSNMAARAVLWSWGGAVQNEYGQVVLDQGTFYKRAVDAVKWLKELQNKAMTPAVFAWNAASNNQALIAGRANFILNSISAYRSAQESRPDIAKDIFFTQALPGPIGARWGNVHILYNYIMPQFAKPKETAAKSFIKHLVENYDQAMYNSKLYNSPAYFNTPVPDGDRGYESVANAQTMTDLFNTWLTDDPFRLEDEAKGKLIPLKNALLWTTNVGHPGYANPAISEIFSTFTLPNMVARTARGEQSAEESVKQAAKEVHQIFDKWRERGLVQKP